MHKVILIRHGQSTWNLENLFTGWTDVPLSQQGIIEAVEAGKALKDAGLDFDIAFTSLLKRAIDTLHIIEGEMNLEWVPEFKSWRLNERHYGALQGLNKAQTAEKYGDDQVKVWRRSFDVRPPALEESDERNPANDPRYALLDQHQLPLVESLKDTISRTIPFWEDFIAPALLAGKKPIVAAHGNSLRGLIKFLEKISDEKIVNLEIPTGIPQVVELDAELNFIRRYECKLLRNNLLEDEV